MTKNLKLKDDFESLDDLVHTLKETLYENDYVTKSNDHNNINHKNVYINETSSQIYKKQHLKRVASPSKTKKERKFIEEHNYRERFDKALNEMIVLNQYIEERKDNNYSIDY